LKILNKLSFECRTAAAAGKVRQDKLLKRSETQLRRNRVPALASSHSDPPESWTLPQGVAAAENQGHLPPAAESTRLEKPTTSWWSTRRSLQECGGGPGRS
jgi:hypothetical protein